jgi:hypothetical protein
MDAVVATMRLGNRKANPSRSASSLPLYPACVNRQLRHSNECEARDPGRRYFFGYTFPRFYFHFFRIGRCLAETARLRGTRNAGERDETGFRHCDHVSRHRGGARPNRFTAEWPDSQWRKHCGVRSSQRTNLNLAIRVTVFVRSRFRIGGRRVGGNKLASACVVTRGNVRLGDLAVVPAIAGRNAGNLDTIGEDDCVGTRRFLTHLRIGPLDGWRFGKPDRDGRRLTRRMLRL